MLVALRPVDVALFGGSFNPPHIAHVLACTLVLATEPIERVLVVPAYRHPFAKALAPYEDRVAMCRSAMGWLPQVEVSRVEETLGGESLTLRTLEHLAAHHLDWRLHMVIGEDVLAEASRWFGFEAIAKLAPPIVLGRSGFTGEGGVPRVLPEVSSTQIRGAVERGDFESIRSLVPRSVLAHIREKGLYGAARAST